MCCMASQRSFTQETSFQLNFALHRVHSYLSHPCRLGLCKEALPHCEQQSETGKLAVDVCQHYNL